MTPSTFLNRPLLVPCLAAALLSSAAFAQAQPAKKSSAPRNGKQAPQTKAAPSKTAPHLALIADPAELLSRVPAAGPLTEEHIILLAIANSPLLEGRRADIALARADKRAVEDWQNPELRLSYGSQDDDFIRDPYTENAIQTYSATESSAGSDTTTSLAGLGELGYGEVTTDTNTSRTATSRYREIERIVTPGRNGSEEVVTNIYELESKDGSGLRDRQFTDGIFTQNRSDALAENVTRTLRSTSRETTTSTESGSGTESFSALIRFQIPHRWERKARIQRASAEIMLAESKYLSDEDKLVREVRDLYQQLGVLESTLAAQQKRRQNYTTFRTEMESANIPEFAMDAARASMDMRGVLRDIREIDSDIAKLREQLAALCGLRSTDRIHSAGINTRRIIDTATLDTDYLVEIAMLYRADMVESRSRAEIARAHLAEAQAAKIPWASFIDAGFTRQWADGHSGEEDEIMARVGFNIPLWEWTGLNKRSREYQKAAAAWEAQMEKQRQRITAEVELAIDGLRHAAKGTKTSEADLRDSQNEAKGILAKLEAASSDLSGYSRSKRAKYDLEDGVQQDEIGRYEAYSDYNKALMVLENALGVRIEKALHGFRDK